MLRAAEVDMAYGVTGGPTGGFTGAQAARLAGTHGHDQASGLRKLLAPRGMRILPLFGATGGAHQAATAAALARGFAELGCRVLIADQSPGALAQEFGLRTRYELSHVLDGDKDWQQVVVSGGDGIAVLPAAKGLARIADESSAGLVLSALAALPEAPDVLLLNLARPDAAHWLTAEADWLTLFSARPSGLVPAYRAIKTLARVARPRSVRVLTCHAVDEQRALEAFGTLAAAVARFLHLDMHYAGELPPGLHRQGLAPRGPHPYQGARQAAPLSLRQLAGGMDGWQLASHVPPQQIRDPRIHPQLHSISAAARPASPGKAASWL